MRKRNLILLSIICILSLCVLSGLMVFAFDMQAKKDLQNKNLTQINDMLSGTPVPTQAASRADNSGSDQSSASGVGTDGPDQNASSGTDTDSDSTLPDTLTTTPEPSITDSGLSEGNSSNTGPIILGFAGDVNLDEASYPSQKYDSEGKDITKCLSGDLLKEMNDADIMMLNNEFAYSTRGTKTLDKSYTFRANPSRVNILKEMGVDIVSLANNHALDYGPDALEDTFATLDNAGIEYIGAGDDLARAKAPVYFTIGDRKIAYVAASRVVFAMNWYASENGMGMIGTYDPTLLLESIREAKANSDYVVVFVHWGVERNSYPEAYQRTMAEQYIDAGADAVIGCHPHVMQGLEFYKGKPIAYSLGNFWFNNSTKNSGMLKLYLDPDGTVRVQLLPAMDKSTYTYLLTDETEKADYYSFMQELSFDVSIDKDGFLTEAAEENAGAQ